MTKDKSQTFDSQAEFFARHAEMCKVFSSPVRLQILSTLRDQEMTVSDLAERLGVAVGNLSQHLNMMKNRRVLVSRKAANNVYYRLGNPKLLRAFDLIREILLDEMRREGSLLRQMDQQMERARHARL
jgi:DNA-binding transcriptional ArsR family regulator